MYLRNTYSALVDQQFYLIGFGIHWNRKIVRYPWKYPLYSKNVYSASGVLGQGGIHVMAAPKVLKYEFPSCQARLTNSTGWSLFLFMLILGLSVPEISINYSHSGFMGYTKTFILSDTHISIVLFKYSVRQTVSSYGVHRKIQYSDTQKYLM